MTYAVAEKNISGIDNKLVYDEDTICLFDTLTGKVQRKLYKDCGAAPFRGVCFSEAVSGYIRTATFQDYLYLDVRRRNGLIIKPEYEVGKNGTKVFLTNRENSVLGYLSFIEPVAELNAFYMNYIEKIRDNFYVNVSFVVVHKNRILESRVAVKLLIAKNNEIGIWGYDGDVENFVVYEGYKVPKKYELELLLKFGGKRIG